VSKVQKSTYLTKGKIINNFEEKIYKNMKNQKYLELNILASLNLIEDKNLGTFANKINVPDQRSVVVPFKIGNLQAYIFSDGFFRADGAQPILAPGIPKNVFEIEIDRLKLSKKFIEGAISVLLIQKEDHFILLDAGAGDNFGENAGKLEENLQNFGISPSQITDIIISHAHVDHIGGLLDKDSQFIYPNAKYYIAEKEYDFWFSESPDFSGSKNDKDPTSSIAFSRKILNAIKDKLVKFQYAELILDCFKPELAEGHTPGHTIFNIESDGVSLRYLTDVFHSTLLVSKPEWGTMWDNNFQNAVSTRSRILEETANSGELLMTCHLPWPSIGHIKKIGGEYHWLAFQVLDPNKIVLN